MSQFNLNRNWIFESTHETDTVLYKGHVASIDRPAPLGNVLLGAADMVEAEVTRVDRLDREYNAAGR